MTKLSLAQKLAKMFSSQSAFEKMKEDSQKWRFTCSNCGKESNIWEIGGIRYKARGKPRTGIKCPHCGKFGLQKLEHRG